MRSDVGEGSRFMDSPVAFVTGAARGIGLATAEWFLSNGHRVAAIDRDGPGLRLAATRWPDPRRALAIKCDVSDRKQVARAVARTVERFGRIDALVNNAGIAIFKPVLETTLADWNAVLANNLTGAF